MLNDALPEFRGNWSFHYNVKNEETHRENDLINSLISCFQDGSLLTLIQKLGVCIANPIFFSVKWQRTQKMNHKAFHPQEAAFRRIAVDR